MAKDTKPVPRPAPKSEFDQFIANSLDRIVEEQRDVQEVRDTVRVEAEQRKVMRPDESGRVREPVRPVYVPAPDPVTEEVMRRRYLPMSHLTGNEVPAVVVKDGADPLLVEAHKLIGDLLAGGMISVQSPLIWQRVKGTQERLRVAISESTKVG